MDNCFGKSALWRCTAFNYAINKNNKTMRGYQRALGFAAAVHYLTIYIHLFLWFIRVNEPFHRGGGAVCVTNPNKRKSSHERLLKNWLGSVSCMLVVQLGLQTHHNMTVSNIAVVFLNERPFGSWVGRIFVVWRNNGGLGAFTTNFSAASQREWLCRQKCFLFQILLLFFIRKSSF